MKTRRAIGILSGLILGLIGTLTALFFGISHPRLFPVFIISGLIIFGYNFIKWAIEGPEVVSTP